MKEKSRQKLLNGQLQEHPTYTKEELKDIWKLLKECEDDKAIEISKILESFCFMPEMFEDWCNMAVSDYDYSKIFFKTPMEDLPLLINEDFDSISNVVFRWRLEHSK